MIETTSNKRCVLLYHGSQFISCYYSIIKSSLCEETLTSADLKVMFHTAIISLVYPVKPDVFGKVFGRVIANQKIPTVFAKVGEVTGRHYITLGIQTSLLSPAPPTG